MKHFIVINSVSFLESHFSAYVKACAEISNVDFEILVLESGSKKASVEAVPIFGLDGKRSSLKGILKLYANIMRRLSCDNTKNIEIVGIQLILMLFPILMIKRFINIVIYVPGIGYAATARFSGIKYHIIRWAIRFVFSVLRNMNNVRFIFENVTDAESLHRRNSKSKYIILPGVGSVAHKTHAETKSISASKNLEIIFVGRLLRDKGVLELIQAIRLLNSTSGNFSYNLKLFGDIDPGNPNSLSLNDLINLEGQYISFEGFQPDINAHLNKSDVFILPSYREGFPKAGIEAAISGIPMILTDVPGCKDLYNLVGSGVLIEPRSRDAIVNALAHFSLNQVKLKQEASAQIARLLSLLDENHIARKHLEFWHHDL